MQGAHAFPSCTEHGEQKNLAQFLAALKRCSQARDLPGGMRLHREAVAAGLDSNEKLASSLITMYSRCRSMALAQQVFEGMPSKDVVTWNCLIMGYVENGDSLVAMDSYLGMDCEADHLTYVAALKACSSLVSEKKLDKELCLQKGIAIHNQVRDRGFDSNILVATTLVDMYSKCGSMVLARGVFNTMTSKTVVTWNSLMLGYVQNGDSFAAMDLFGRMDWSPSSVTYVAALKACGSLATENASRKQACLEKGIAIHKQVKDSGFYRDIVVANSLVDMYCKCGSMNRAREMFNGMRVKDVVTWNSLILGYVQNGESSVALELFSSMDRKRCCITYVAALKACGALASQKETEKESCLSKGIAIHDQVRASGFGGNLTVGNTLVDMYSKCGSMDRARQVFYNMASKDVVTWNCLILGYVLNGESSVALDLFTSMDCQQDSVTYIAALKACGALAVISPENKQDSLQKGMVIHKQVKDHGCGSNLVVTASLVDMYSKCGSMDRAREVFDRSCSKDVVMWNSLIWGYVQNGDSFTAMDLFSRMECEPDGLTYVAALKACRSSAAVVAGQEIHARVCKAGMEHEPVLSSLIDFYAKCGSTDRAEELFNNVDSPSLVCWNALIDGFGSCGDASRVFSLVKEMQAAGVRMDGLTFLSVLTACSHAGLVEEGKLYFESMPGYGISASVEHYNCLVDMLGRANRLHEALAVVQTMPVEANPVTWTTLLWACSSRKNTEVGKVAFDALMASSPTRTAAYVLMRDSYKSL